MVDLAPGVVQSAGCGYPLGSAAGGGRAELASHREDGGRWRSDTGAYNNEEERGRRKEEEGEAGGDLMDDEEGKV
jgi:hypothetical protein